MLRADHHVLFLLAACAVTTTQGVAHSSRAFCAKGGRQSDRTMGVAILSWARHIEDSDIFIL
jgi:hypothetical protein